MCTSGSPEPAWAGPQHCTGHRPQPHPMTQRRRSLGSEGPGPILLPPPSHLQGLSQAEPKWKRTGEGVTDPMYYRAGSQAPGPQAGGGGRRKETGRQSRDGQLSYVEFAAVVLTSVTVTDGVRLTEGRQGTRGLCPPVQPPGRNQGDDMGRETPVLRSSQTGRHAAMF